MKLDFRKHSHRALGRSAWHRMNNCPDGGAENANLAMQWMAFCDRTNRLFYV